MPGESGEGDMNIELNTFLTPLSICSLCEGPTYMDTDTPIVFSCDSDKHAAMPLYVSKNE